MLNDAQRERLAARLPSWLKRSLWALSVLPSVLVVALVFARTGFDRLEGFHLVLVLFMVAIAVINLKQYWPLRSM